MASDEKMPDEDFTILPFDFPSNKIGKGIISTWIFAFIVSIMGIWLVQFSSSEDCAGTACSLEEITNISIGLTLILVGGFIALVGFMVLVKTREREAITMAKEEAILKQALNEGQQ